MTFQEFNVAILRDPILGKLLPLQVRRTYPRFSLEDSVLCASFVGFRVVPGDKTPNALPPAYYLKITCPTCTLLAFEKRSGASSDQGLPMTPRSPEDVKELAALCDQVLNLYEEKSDKLEEVLAAYNALLDALLEPEQREILDSYAATPFSQGR